MRIYCYKTLDGELIEVMDEPGMAAQTIELKDGRIAHRDYQSELASGSAFVKKTSRLSTSWPMVCYASGVHASQAGELREHFKKHGLNIEVNKEGDPIYTSAIQRRKALKCRGLYDRNSFC